MCHRCVLYLDAEFFGELLEFAHGEVGAVVGDDAIWQAVSVDDRLKKLDRRSRFLIGDWDDFNPLGEFVDGDQEVSVASSR
jgi:hypothetical protein